MAGMEDNDEHDLTSDALLALQSLIQDSSMESRVNEFDLNEDIFMIDFDDESDTSH